jgi:N-acetylglucosamine kinase-like BadF-type ATPase
MSRLGKFSYPTSPAVLAVDGGNSKTDVALVGPDGDLLGAARGPGSSHHDLGVPAAMDTLEALTAAACDDAGLPAGDRPLAEVGVWCLAGLDLPADDQALGPAVAGRRWSRRVLLHNDVFAVLRAGCRRAWGVGVVLGAGINCVGVASDGREVRFPALGELSGDWGGGRDVGVAAVGAALRGEDGRGPATTLTRLVPGHFGLPTALAVVEALFRGRVDRRRVLELVPLVFAEAEAGDPAAEAIVDRQVAEVVAMAAAAIRRLGLAGTDVEVACGGGLIAGGGPAFFERIGAGIRQLAPRARLTQVTAPPVLGAALLGLDRLGAPPGAAERLRATLTAERLRALDRSGPRPADPAEEEQWAGSSSST